MKNIKTFNDFFSINESVSYDEFDILILKDINDNLKEGDVVTIIEIIDYHIFITSEDISFSIKNFSEFEYWKELEDEEETDEDDIEFERNPTFSKVKTSF